MTTIDIYSFYYSGLTSIIFNENIEISRYAFRYCYKLKEVNLVEVRIKTLELGFFGNSNLETIYLPKLLIAMKEVVFENNPLKNIFCYSNILSFLIS